MYSDTQILTLGPEKLTYLNNKHRGGSNNQRGDSYEHKYTFLLIARAASAYFAQSKNVTIAVQVKCFVDDAVYDTGSLRTHFQLRDVQALTWKSGSHQPLWKDFQDQHTLNTVSGVPATETKLVVSTQGLRDKLHNSIPPTISAHSEVIFFPSVPFDDLRKELEIQEGLTELCHTPDTDLGQILATMSFVFGHWLTKEYASVDFETFWRDMCATNAKIRRGGAQLTPNLKGVLDQIPGLSYQTDRGYLSWRYGAMDSGTVPEPVDSPTFRKIAKLIETQKPTTFEMLEGMLL